jgi:predicted Zn-dependent protease
MKVGQIDPDDLAAEALEKVLRGRDPQPLEGGAYDVVLEGYAVADMLKYFGQHAFGAPAVSEGTSFLSGRMGDRVMSRHVTIWDDGFDPNGLRQPFDFEAVPKRKVVIIDEGVANAAVHDRSSARKARVDSTGHALPPTFTYLRGPFPLNMFMAEGTAGKDDLLRSIKRGIWVSRFHYTAIVDARRMILTGLTRDGTFLIEDGRFTKPLRNMRFVQNCVDALSQVEAVGGATQLVRTKVFRDFYSVSRVPALKIQRFTFTGVAGP